VLRHRIVMVVVFVAVLAGTVRMYGIVPKGFIPDQDNDMLFVNMSAAQGTSFYDMAAGGLRAAEIIRKNPYVDSFVMNLGGNNYNGGGSSNFQMPIQLVPRAQRPVSAQQIAQQLRPQLLRFPNFRAFVRIPPALQIGFGQGNSSYNVTVQSADTDQLYTWAERLSAAMETRIPEIQDVSNNLEIKSPKVNLVIDRDKAAAVGLNATQIENALSAGFGPKWSSTIYGDTTQYRVLLELDPKYQEYADSLNKLTFKTPRGALIPLPAVVSMKETVGPQSVNHFGQLPSVNISFGLRPGVSLGAAVDRIRQLAAGLLPATVNVGFEGSAKVFQESTKNLAAAVCRHRRRSHRPGRAYESHIHPVTILGPAVGGLPRRARHAVAVRQRAEHLLVRWSRHVDRDRQEERDHADRLRARRRTQARHDAGRGHLRGLPRPIPAHHDDDDGRAARRAADRGRVRCGRRSAAAAGPGRRRRPHLLPVTDALPDAGRLHLHGADVPDEQDSRDGGGETGHGLTSGHLVIS
jgi:HAE1 family hydrophobic/amphiphilic exporter-1